MTTDGDDQPMTKEEPAKEEPAKEEAKPTDEKKPAEEKQPVEKPAEEKKAEGEQIAAARDVIPVSLPKAGPWNQWGGSSLRNNTPASNAVFTDFKPGGFDRKTGAWLKDKAKNIKWVTSVGSQTYGNPVVASGKLVVGT
ncbi:MAG TPA: serine/threonine protein kinase, partial [bacterium]|nr:serine/threonine protein kinase [bacterium]